MRSPITIGPRLEFDDDPAAASVAQTLEVHELAFVITQGHRIRDTKLGFAKIGLL
jgi:hypothetical protein